MRGLSHLVKYLSLFIYISLSLSLSLSLFIYIYLSPSLSLSPSNTSVLSISPFIASNISRTYSHAKHALKRTHTHNKHAHRQHIYTNSSTTLSILTHGIMTLGRVTLSKIVKKIQPRNKIKLERERETNRWTKGQTDRKN